MTCDLCEAPAEYRICTDVAVPGAVPGFADWLPMNRVYKHRYYCLWHFALQAEQLAARIADQEARRADRQAEHNYYALQENADGMVLPHGHDGEGGAWPE